MTEAEWLACDDPMAMHAAVPRGLEQARHNDERTRRRRHFFGAACCRLIWPLITDERSRRAVEYMERQFDEELSLSHEHARAILRAADTAIDNLDPDCNELQHEAAFSVHIASEPAYVIDSLVRFFDGWGDPTIRAREIANLMRDIVGNPFRPGDLLPILAH